MKNQTKAKEKKRKGGKAKKILLVIFLILLVGGSVFGYKVYKNGGGISGFLATFLGHNEETVNTLDEIYCLILGKSQNLTDTIILASYDPKTQEAAMLSIPRDTFVGDSKYSATAWDKINAIYQTGPEKVLKEVKELTGIDVKYYLMVDTEALKVLVDEIGGVTFNVPIDMDYDDNKQGLHIHLEAGEQKLDGDKAEQVVRFRHNQDGSTYPASYGIEDIGRMRTQRDFLKALAAQTLTPANLTKIPDFLDIAEKYVETNLDFNSVKDYVPYAVNFNVDNLQTDKLPGEAELTNGVWIYSVDEEEAEKVIQKLFFGITDEETVDGNVIGNTTADNGTASTSTNSSLASAQDKNISVEVLNGSGSRGNLSAIVSDLKAAGYEVNKIGTTTKTANTTIITRGSVSDTTQSELKDLLGTGSIVSGEESGNTDITVIIGTDYKTN